MNTILKIDAETRAKYQLPPDITANPVKIDASIPMLQEDDVSFTDTQDKFGKVPSSPSHMERIQQSSRITQRDNIGYVVIFNIESPLITELPALAIQLIKGILDKAGLSDKVAELDISNAVKGKQLLLTDTSQSSACAIAIPTSSSITTDHCFTFISTNQQDRGTQGIEGFSRQIQFHSLALITDIDILRSPKIMLAYRAIPMGYVNFACSYLSSWYKENAPFLPVQVIAINCDNTYKAMPTKYSKEPMVLVIAHSDAQAATIKRFYSILPNEVLTKDVARSLQVPGLPLEVTTDVQKFFGRQFLGLPPHHAYKVAHLCLDTTVEEVMHSAITAIPPETILSIFRDGMVDDEYATYYIILNNAEGPPSTSLNLRASPGKELTSTYLNILPAGFASTAALSKDDRQRHSPAGRASLPQVSSPEQTAAYQVLNLKLDGLRSKVDELSVAYQVLNLKLDELIPKIDALGILPAITTDVHSIMQECQAMTASLVKLAPPPTFAFGSPPHKIAALNRNNMEMAPTIPVASNTFPFFEAHGVQTTSSTSSTNQLI